MIVGLQIADVQHFEHLMDTKSYTNHLYVVIKHSQAVASHGNLRNVTATARYRKYFNFTGNATTSPYASSSQHGSVTANATASQASQHNMTVQLPPQLPPLRQICAHTPLKALSVPVFPQVRHFMHKHVFHNLGSIRPSCRLSRMRPVFGVHDPHLDVMMRSVTCVGSRPIIGDHFASRAGSCALMACTARSFAASLHTKARGLFKLLGSLMDCFDRPRRPNFPYHSDFPDHSNHSHRPNH